MGKAYGHQYFFAGSGSKTGTMECAGCRKAIDNETQDWMSYKKPAHGDWGFVCWHRDCREDPQWAAIENRNAENAAEYAAMLREFRAFAAKWQHREGWLHDVYEEVTEGQSQ